MMFGRDGSRLWICGVILSAPLAVLADPQQFDIPAQPLPSALKAFALQAHVQLLYVYNVVADGRGNAVRGELDARRALDELLRGTGFEAAYASDTEITIRRAPGRAVNDSRHGERLRLDK
jgi:hypothetical protein